MTAIGVVLPLVGASTADTLRTVVDAETAGIDSVWFTENFYTRGAFAIAGAAAASTERIRIGTGTVSPLVRHPAIMAMEAVALAELAQGRFRLGVGPGSLTKLARVGVSEARPLSLMSDLLAYLRGGLAGEGDGADVARFGGAAPPLEPPPDAGSVPVYLGASGPRMLSLAGAAADGVLLSLLAPRPFLATAVATVLESAAAAGREPSSIELVAFVPVCCDADRDRAREAARGFVADNIVRFAGNDALEALLTQAPELSLEVIRSIADAHAVGSDHVALVSEDVLDALAVAGDPDDCALGLTAWTALGVTEIAAAPVGGAALVPATLAALAAAGVS